MNPKTGFYFLIGILAITALIGLGGFYWADQQLAARAGKISDLKAENEALDEYIINANQAEDKLEELSYLSDVAEQVLPSTKVQSNLIAEVIAIGDKAGVHLDAINFSNSATSGSINFDISQTTPLKEVKNVNVFEFSVVSNRTTYSNLIQFLDLLEENRRKMQVASVRISPEINTAGQPTGKISIELVIDVYVRVTK